MWTKIKTAIYTACLFIAGWAGFIWGMLFYKNKLDKAETENAIHIGNLKANRSGDIVIPFPGETAKMPIENVNTEVLKPIRTKIFIQTNG